MYNQEIKEQFLSEYITGGKEINGCRSMFQAFEKYEMEIGMDLAEMSVADVSKATRLLSTGTYKTAADVQSRIKTYVKWCGQNKRCLNVNANLFEIKIDDIDASVYFKSTMFRNEEELVRELQTVRRFDEGFTEGVILLLAWLGIEQRDVMSIKVCDVDLKQRKVFVQKYGKFLDIPETILNALEIYEKTKVGSRSSGGTYRPVYRDDSYDTYVRKYCPSGQLGDKPLTPARIRSSVGVISQLYVDQGKPSRLWNGNILASGALNRLWCLEQSGVDVFSQKNSGLVLNAFVVSAKMHEITWMYRNYKRAFGL